MELESVGTKIARGFRLGYQIAESYMEKQSQRCAEGPLKYRTSWWQEATVGWGRNHGKGFKEAVMGTHTREWNLFPPTGLENLMICGAWALGTGVQQSLALSDAVNHEE